MKNRILLFALFFLPFFLFAAPPAGYYPAAQLDGKNTSALRSALKTIIETGHATVGYNGLWAAYGSTDLKPSTNYIWDMYSNCNLTYQADQDAGGSGPECTYYNREHTTPQSWFSGAEPMYSDLFNVYPTDKVVNAARSNYPYGEVTSPTYTSGNGSKLGPNVFAGYSGAVFEPVDEYKGDFARTYFYMATRYAGLCENWSGEGAAVYGSANLGFTTYAMNLFLKWSRQDPISQKEVDRNDAVYGKQNNRNPFIDFAGLEEYIWGNKTGEAFSTTIPSTAGVIRVGNVVNSGATLVFGKVTSSTTKSLTVKTTALTGDLTVAVTGTGYSVSATTITKDNANTGYNLTVTFNPLAVGTFNGTLTISGGGLSPNYSVSLSGSK